jgi:hypothetical protein
VVIPGMGIGSVIILGLAAFADRSRTGTTSDTFDLFLGCSLQTEREVLIEDNFEPFRYFVPCGHLV